MKCNTIGIGDEGKKASLTIYADMDVSTQKMITNSDPAIVALKNELEIVQKALKLQTKRCRQLVAEYTKKLQQKEQQYQSERTLRDDQLAKVLRALLLFEARLRQEQKYITRQLEEKDVIIKKQHNNIRKLLSNQYCKNCNQYYSPSSNLESLESSSEYVVTDYQSSNFESFDSGSDIYATISEKSFTIDKNDNQSLGSGEENSKTESESTKNIYQKNKNHKDSLGRKTRKFQHRKSIGTYFEVLKMRNETASPCSNEDNTSNDYDNLDSLPAENSDKASEKSVILEMKNEEELKKENDDSSNISTSDCNNTVINQMTSNEDAENKVCKISDTIPVFEADGETNDNWYASASDQEDEEHRDIYRNNPVLECMNQILLQNINDTLNSPPKTPNIERKTVKNNKKVKFSDEEEQKSTANLLTEENLAEKTEKSDYYETPIQKTPNFYETPQSIYSNDYEQILSKCSETFSSTASVKLDDSSEKKSVHVYIDMDPKSESENKERKQKILRTPPALPPKPANLVSKYKLNNNGKIMKEAADSIESEPDYCSISELNLPTNKTISFKKINVIAEINSPNSQDVLSKLEKATKPKPEPDYDPVMVNDHVPRLVVKKCVEKFNIQLAKQTTIKPDTPKKIEPEIPKLPQVSEIIIPDEEEDEKKQERISHDNYVKNNSQILRTHTDGNRRSIVMGTSVSSLITGFNNQQIISEIKKPERHKAEKKMFASFESLQNLDKHTTNDTIKTNFNDFDLSQNFEEFKLDECEIEEYKVDMPDVSDKSDSGNSVEMIRATSEIIIPNLSKNSVELLKKRLELQKNGNENEQEPKKSCEPTYEHFLECTGLSSKSILTPSRLLSNHKSMLKPKDVKLRSKVRSNNFIEKQMNGTVKYWSEPYV